MNFIINLFRHENRSKGALFSYFIEIIVKFMRKFEV